MSGFASSVWTWALLLQDGKPLYELEQRIFKISLMFSAHWLQIKKRLQAGNMLIMEEKTKLDGYCFYYLLFIPLVKDESHTLNNTNGWRCNIQPWTNEIDSSLLVKHIIWWSRPHTSHMAAWELHLESPGAVGGRLYSTKNDVCHLPFTSWGCDWFVWIILQASRGAKYTRFRSRWDTPGLVNRGTTWVWCLFHCLWGILAKAEELTGKPLGSLWDSKMSSNTVIAWDRSISGEISEKKKLYWLYFGGKTNKNWGGTECGMWKSQV